MRSTSQPLSTRPGAAIKKQPPAANPARASQPSTPRTFRGLASGESFDLRADSAINLEHNAAGRAAAAAAAKLIEDVVNARDLGALDWHIRAANSDDRQQRDAAATLLFYLAANAGSVFSACGVSWRTQADIRYLASQGMVGLGPMLGEVIAGLRLLFKAKRTYRLVMTHPKGISK